MREISDLTRDTRPPLENILIDATHDIVEIDRKRDNYNGDYVELENKSFYYRVIYLFMNRSVMYYTKDEIESWSKRELLKEVILPDLHGFKLDSLQ